MIWFVLFFRAALKVLSSFERWLDEIHAEAARYNEAWEMDAREWLRQQQ